MRTVLRRAAVLPLGVALALTGAAPALAAIGDPAPANESTAATYLIFLGGPLAVMALVALFTVGARRGVGALRYRPGLPWGFGPSWVGGQEPPAEPEAGPMVLGGGGGARGKW